MALPTAEFVEFLEFSQRSLILMTLSTQYKLFDGGICMGNVTLALEALSTEGQWLMYRGAERNIPAHPTDLRPMATLLMGGDHSDGSYSEHAGDTEKVHQ